MSIDQKTAAQAPASARTAPEPPAGFGHGRSGLVVPLILAVFSTYLLIGVLTMEVPEGTDPPGPTFFPTIVLAAGYVIAVLLALRILKTPEPAEPATFGEHDDVSDEERRAAEEAAAVQYPAFTDWRCVAWAVGGFLAFAALLQFAGWILAAALLFWCVARAMDSRTPLRDVVVALTVSSIVYLAFGVALGLNLPSGLIGGGF